MPESTPPAQPFRWTVRVYYEDTDAGGVVYYANYLRYFERARTEWLRSIGFSHRELAGSLGLQFVVVGIECDYRQPARLDDVLSIALQIEKAGRASIVFDQRAQRGEDLLAAARVRVACVDVRGFAPQPLPAAMLAAARGLMRD